MEYPSDDYKIIQGDCLEVIKGMADKSVDLVLTDPPYELGFMGKTWDRTGIANNVELWKECLRVLKPGGHLLAFSGTRTYHRMASAIEDSGFEVRDMIEWVYGSGFPKSLNIGKAVDKLNRVNPDIAQRIAKYVGEECKKKFSNKELAIILGRSETSSFMHHWGGGAHYIPRFEELKKLRDLIELPKEFEGDWTLLEGEYERELLGIHQTDMGGLGGERLGVSGGKITKGTSEWEGWGTALKPSHEPICMARKPLAEKTVAENCLKYGTGGINIDESRVEAKPRKTGTKPTSDDATGSGNTLQGSSKNRQAEYDEQNLGRFPANLIHDNSEEVRECFPETKSGTIKPYKHANRNNTCYGEQPEYVTFDKEGDLGNASRFFKSIIYQAKASKSDRGKDNKHPTVKPTALMEYLIKMASKEGDLILDPFAGSCTTLLACKQLKRRCICIEKEADYIRICNERLERSTNSLF